MNFSLRFQKMIAVCLLLMGLFESQSSFAQTNTDSVPLYKKFPFVPSFKLMKVDSTTFYMKDVATAKKQPTVVIVFSPSCSHCQHQAEEITSHMKDFENTTFLFVTGYPLSEMQQYINSYGLDKFPNIYIGQDYGRNLANFYKIRSIPGVFVYNKKGNLVDEYDTNIKAETLVAAMKK